jgi:amino acid adenylation domain-containing protein
LTCVLASTSLNFDLSIFEMFTPLVTGGRCLIVESILSLLTNDYSQQNISLINTVASGITAILKEKAIPDSVITINLAGEVLKKVLVDSLYDSYSLEKVVNLYGPSEDTTYSLFSLVEKDGREPAIGRPISNTTIYVLDKSGELAPIGTIGELYLGGAGLARGYLNQPALTAERFVQNPFSDKPNDRLYKTGDLVRYLPDGNLEFIGRIDDQVKVRGFRIELGEIESQLSQCDSVAACLLLAREDELGQKRLVAYVVAKTNDNVNEALDDTTFVRELREQLQNIIPDYMVPSAFVVMDEFPLTANGKVDRETLPAPDGTLLQGEYVAPATETEHILVEVWAKLLKLESKSISVTANFFELGGHSLLISQIIHEAENKYGFILKVKDFFDAPTIIEQSVMVENSLKEDIFLLKSNSKGVSEQLSYTQYRIWFIGNIGGNPRDYNIPFGIKIKGRVELEYFESALDLLVQRHEILRTNIVKVNGQPQQIIQEKLKVKIKYIDLVNLNNTSRCQKVKDLVDGNANKVFELNKLPLMAALLIKLTDDEYLFHLNFHHLIFDGWSLVLFINEFLECYKACVQNRQPELEPLKYNYRDYSAWQSKFLTSKASQKQEIFWREYLKCSVEKIRLPFQEIGCDALSSTDRVVANVVDIKTKRILMKLASKHKGSLFNVMHSALVLLVCRLSNEYEFNIGIPVTGRNIPGTQNILGAFLNILPVRSKIDLVCSFSDFLRSQIENVAGVLSNQDIPFERILEVSDAKRNLNSTPLFQIFLNMLSLPEVQMSNQEFELSMEDIPDFGNKFDITFYVMDTSEGVSIICNFNNRLFTSENMALMLQQYVSLLKQIATSSEESCGDYSLCLETSIKPFESQSLEMNWKGPVHKCFESVVEEFPEKQALWSSSNTWSYSELNNAINKYAHKLIVSGVQPGDVVAIMADRTDSLVVATIAILKAGAAFMMLSNSVSENRVLQQVREVVPRCLITLGDKEYPGDELMNFLTETGCSIIPVIANKEESSIESTALREFKSISVQQNDLACVGFTSGTSGLPKAVQIKHSSLSIFMPWMAKAFDINSEDRFCMLSSLVHDPLQRDIFTPLCLGATLCVPNEDELNANRISSWLAQNRVTVLHLTPSLGTMLLESVNTPNDRLRLGFFVGEPLTTAHVRKFKQVAPKMAAINLYGSTETSRAVSYYRVDDCKDLNTNINKVLPVGKGIEGVSLVILNSTFQKCGIGEVGQIGIRSEHLSLGYHKDSALTKLRFVDGHNARTKEDLVYLTGDLGRYRADGQIECIGRMDKQIKIRGFRVEPCEIETVIVQHEEVSHVVVAAASNSKDELYIVACIVTEKTVLKDDFIHKLRSWLRERLPDYMVPSHFLIVDEVPLTENGKLDTNRLFSLNVDSETKVLEKPATKIEAELLDVWLELLDVTEISVLDDFFSIGGHSLLTTKLLVRLQNSYGIEFNYKEFFEDSTIRALARQIENSKLTDIITQSRPNKNKVVL